MHVCIYIYKTLSLTHIFFPIFTVKNFIIKDSSFYIPQN